MNLKNVKQLSFRVGNLPLENRGLHSSEDQITLVEFEKVQVELVGIVVQDKYIGCHIPNPSNLDQDEDDIDDSFCEMALDHASKKRLAMLKLGLKKIFSLTNTKWVGLPRELERDRLIVPKQNLQTSCQAILEFSAIHKKENTIHVFCKVTCNQNQFLVFSSIDPLWSFKSLNHLLNKQRKATEEEKCQAQNDMSRRRDKLNTLNEWLESKEASKYPHIVKATKQEILLHLPARNKLHDFIKTQFVTSRPHILAAVHSILSDRKRKISV